MGSVKILTPAAGIFLDNGVGDGTFQVSIAEAKDEKPGNFSNFAGYFEIYGSNCFLMEYDCKCSTANQLYEFPTGRYYTEHDEDGNIFIKRFQD